MFGIFYKAKTHHKVYKLFSAFAYCVAIFSPLFVLPQLVKIWQQKNAQELSLLTWGGYTFGALLWFIYGIVHKEKPIVITNLMLFVIYSAILVSMLIYR